MMLVGQGEGLLGGELRLVLQGAQLAVHPDARGRRRP